MLHGRDDRRWQPAGRGDADAAAGARGLDGELRRRPRQLSDTPAAELLAPFRAQPGTSAVLLDYDGSLAPIVRDPAAAVPSPEAVDALRALVARGTRVGLVSGRPVTFLRDVLGLAGVAYVGQYGLEHLDADGQVRVDPRVEPYLDAVASAVEAAESAWPGLLVERKGEVAVTVHWRDADVDEDEVTRWADETGARLGLMVLPTRRARELRPPVPADKGTAVRELARGRSAALFAGDDHGDLAAFAALGALVDEGTLAHAVRVGVRSAEAPPELAAATDLMVDGPPGLAALLTTLL